MQRFRAKLSYANVMSTIAVFLALGGATAFAATKLGRESVGTRHLKKGAVTPAKLSPSAKAKLAGRKGPTGATGPAGPQGVPGPKGDAGPTGAPGSARAWAEIGENGVIERGVGIASVSHQATGFYCVHLDSAFQPGTFTALATISGGYSEHKAVSVAPGGCDPNAVQVNTWNTDDGSATDGSFALLVP